MDAILGVRDGLSFAVVVLKEKNRFYAGSKPPLSFSSNKGVKDKILKAFVGVVLIPCTTYNTQTHFEVEGIFSIKVTRWGLTCVC